MLTFINIAVPCIILGLIGLATALITSWAVGRSNLATKAIKAATKNTPDKEWSEADFRVLEEVKHLPSKKLFEILSDLWSTQFLEPCNQGGVPRYRLHTRLRRPAE